MFKNRYKYTCPDVVNYRKNQYRLFVWSSVINYAMLVAFVGAFAIVSKKTENELDNKFKDLENE